MRITCVLRAYSDYAYLLNQSMHQNYYAYFEEIKVCIRIRTYAIVRILSTNRLHPYVAVLFYTLSYTFIKYESCVFMQKYAHA